MVRLLVDRERRSEVAGPQERMRTPSYQKLRAGISGPGVWLCDRIIRVASFRISAPKSLGLHGGLS